MAAATTSYLSNLEHGFSSKPRFRRPLIPSNTAPRILAMAPKKKHTEYFCLATANRKNSRTERPELIKHEFVVNKFDDNWKKQWFGAGLFYEGSEQVEVDVFKKLEKRKVLSTVEKAGLLSKAEELGFTLSSIEKLGLFSKAEELGLLSLLEKSASFSPAALASAALPILVAAILTIVFIPDDTVGLVAAQAVLAGALGLTAVGLFVGSVVLDGLQEAD